MGRAFYNPSNTAMGAVVWFIHARYSTARLNGCIFRERVLEY
jgi:hypothetical protein